MTLSRRSFLRTAAASVSVGGITYFLPPFPKARGEDTPKPSEQIRIASIGVGNQGNGNTKTHAKNVVAVCEVDKTRLADAVKLVEKAGGKTPAAETDYREILERRTSTPWSSPRRTTGTP